jgi:glucosamine kinase
MTVQVPANRRNPRRMAAANGLSGTILVLQLVRMKALEGEKVKLRYLIGVDGGGTGTRARIAQADGGVLATGHAGPSALGQGVQQAWKHVEQAIGDAARQAGLSELVFEQCGIALGLSGAHVRSRRDAFLASAPDFGHIALFDDGSTTLHGALRGAPGAVIAAGTGSIGEALWPDGRRVTVGGWGFGVGDEGSGAWLGLRAMRIAHRVQDGRLPASPLAEALFDIAGRDRAALLAWAERSGQAAYAALAPLVFELETRDPAAARLVGQAVQALEATAAALDPAGRLPLVLTGSIGLRLRPRLATALQARLVEPAGDSADGALWLAQRALQAG